MEEAKLQEFSLECMESMTIHPTTCLFHVDSSKQVQLHPEAALIFQFCVALTMRHEIFIYRSTIKLQKIFIKLLSINGSFIA